MNEEQKWLDFYSETIKELSQLGMKVIIKIAEDKRYSIYKTLPGVLYVLKFFEILDSISLNIKYGITSTATNGLNRICTEYFFGAFYLLKNPNEFERKSMAIAYLSLIDEEEKFKPFYLSNLTKTFKKIKEEYGFKSDFDPGSFNYSKVESYYKKLLGHKDFTFVRKEYEVLERLLASRKIQKIGWYTFWNGPKNIYQVARDNDQIVLYDMFYREFCHDVHGSRSFSKDLFFIDKDFTLYINDFRVPININSCVYPSVYLSHLLFKEIFNKYLHINDIELSKEISLCMRNFFSKLPKEDPIDIKNNRVILFPD